MFDRDIESARSTVIKKSLLIEKTKFENQELNYGYMLRIPSTPQNSTGTCYGVIIRCKPILYRKLNVHTKINPLTEEKNYLWPWEASVFVDGKYHCPAVLLENDLLLSSLECGEGIE